MILINYTIRPSNTHGIGLFADELITVGKVICKPSPQLDSKITKKTLAKLHPNERKIVEHYGYLGKDNNWHLAFDDTRFLNHSHKPNVGIDADGSIVSLREIQKGEEIFQNYSDFEIDPRF